MGLSTTVLKLDPGVRLDAATLARFLSISHPDTPIVIKIGDALVEVREIRQVTTNPGEPVLKVLVPVDFSFTTK